MFPNPQEALPLPLRPDLQQYRKLAKDLVKACGSGEPGAPTGAIGAWAKAWLSSLQSSLSGSDTDRAELGSQRAARNIEEFAVAKLTAGPRKCVLADAQFVIARLHGFDSWPKLVAHIDALAHSDSEAADFEAAADAIVAGDEAKLRRLLQANPALVRARSTREHRATLLHYVSANGVEGYRQKTPGNAVKVAEILLEAGAEVDAEMDVYRGKCTALGLVATSVHPFLAGVQNPLMQLLLDHGADINHPDLAGNNHSTIVACLANGRGEAAQYLAERGARLGLIEAAGIGRIDVVRTFFDARGNRKAEVTSDEVFEALLYACDWGSKEVVAFLLDHGAELSRSDRDRQTPLHHAAMCGNLEVLALLLSRGAPLEARNVYGGTVLDQAIWCAGHGGDPDLFVQILSALIAAGARVPELHPPVNEKVDAALARHGSAADPMRYWYGEEP